MAMTPNPIQPLFRLSLVTLLVLSLYLAAFVGVMAVTLSLGGAAETRNLSDFDIFHLAGSMAWDGELEGAYRSRSFFALQAEVSSGRGFMTWTYPPQFGLVAAALALMPAWLAYLIFTGVSLAAYLVALRRIAGDHLPAVLLVLLPVLLIGIWNGQNGFLTGSLVAIFALLARRGARTSGLPLGFMVIKPHLALGLGVLLLISRRWRWTAQAAAVIAGTSLLCSVLFGPGIWSAFLEGVAESKAILEVGNYSLHRMTSVYALLRSAGAGAEIALGFHLGVALCGIAVVGLAVGRNWAVDRTLAAATLASLLVSPYLHDYDMTVLGVALALMARDLAAPPARRLFPMILLLTWGGLVYAYASGLLIYHRFLAGTDFGFEDRPMAWAGLAVPSLVVLLFTLLYRAEQGGQRAAPAGSDVLA